MASYVYYLSHMETSKVNSLISLPGIELCKIRNNTREVLLVGFLLEVMYYFFVGCFYHFR